MTFWQNINEWEKAIKIAKIKNKIIRNILIRTWKTETYYPELTEIKEGKTEFNPRTNNYW